MVGILLDTAGSAGLAIGPTSLDLPAWIQAIGSIVAIAIAIVLPRLDIRRGKRERAIRDRDFVDYLGQEVLRATREVVRQWESQAHALTSDDSIIVSKTDGFYALTALRRFETVPPHEWPDYRVAKGYADWSRFMKGFIDNWAALRKLQYKKDQRYIEKLEYMKDHQVQNLKANALAYLSALKMMGAIIHDDKLIFLQPKMRPNLGP